MFGTSTGSVPESRVFRINTALADDDVSGRIFKSYAAAASWIVGNLVLTDTDHATIKIPSGYLNEDIIAYQYVDIQGYRGARAKSIVGDVTYSMSPLTILDSNIDGVSFDTVYVKEGKVMNFTNCEIAYIEPYDLTPGYGDGYIGLDYCTLYGGNFSNVTETFSSWCLNRFMLQNAAVFANNIHIRNSIVVGSEVTFNGGCKITSCYFSFKSIYMNAGPCVFYNSEVSGEKYVYGTSSYELHNTCSNAGNVALVDPGTKLVIFHGSDCDGTASGTGTIEDKRYVLPDNSALASATTVGTMRYYKTGNNSYFDVVMQTGAATYDWVNIKTNTW